MLFTCEHCGKRIKVAARSQGKRGRCSNCGQVIVIPHFAGDTHATDSTHAQVTEPPPSRTHAHAHEPISSSDAPFRLSPPESRPGPGVMRDPPVLVEPTHLERHVTAEVFSEFELIAEDDNPESAALASPEIQRGLQQLEEFQTDRLPYELTGSPDESRLFRWDRASGPAGWLLVNWRKGVGLVLRLLRVVDDWAYLISVPFIVLMVFAIAIANRGLVHTGAVVVVLANYGRFWADLLALFIRPFKEGPVHGLAFLFPPYGFYYLWTRWDKFKPTFRRILTSCIPILLVVLAYAYLPFINPASSDARSFPEKIRSGGRELVNEIRNDVKEIREDVRNLKKKTPARGEPGDPLRESAQ